MPLQDQNVSIEFGKGVDTKTDPKAVKAKLLRLQDAVFTEGMQIDKRNGYTQITSATASGSLSSPPFLASLEDQLVTQSIDTLYSYSPSSSEWVSAGPYVSCKATVTSVSASTIGQVLQSACFFGNYGVYTWNELDGNALPTSPAALLTVQDLTTGAYKVVVAPDFPTGPLANKIQATKTFVLSTTTPGTVSIDNSGNLVLVTYAIASGVSTFGPFTLYAPGTAINFLTFNGSATVPAFDAVGTATGGVAAVCTGTTLQVVTFDTFGTVTHTASITGASTLKGVSITVGPNGNIWVYYTNAATDIRYAIFSPALAPVLASTVVSTGTTVFQVTAIPTSNTVQKIFFTLANSVTADSTNLYSGTTNSSGVSSFSQLITNVDIYTKPFVYNNMTYLGVIYRSILQGTVFIVGVDNTSAPGAVVAKLLAGEAFSFFQASLGATNPTITTSAASPFGFLAAPLTYSASKTGFMLPKVIVVDTVFGGAAEQPATCIGAIDFADQDIYQALIANKTLVMNGGILWQYDGTSSCELGFNLYPEIVAASVSSSGGNLAAGDYIFAAIFQWSDNQGNFHQSAPSFWTVKGLTGSTSSVTLTIKTPGISVKTLPDPPRVALFRSQVNQNFLTLANLPYEWNRGTSSITANGSAADSEIASDDKLYTNGGVLENIGPPPSTALTLFANRLWIADSTNPNTVWYSKTLLPGVGISTSDLLIDEVNAIGGDIVGLAGMDSNLVVFEQNQPLVITGDGNNDAGTGSTLTPAQPIPSDAGCTGSKGIIVFPQGILRKTPKGIYRLDRSLNDAYWGYDVEAYNSQAITSSLFLKDKTQIRFLCSSGLTLVYDYFFNQWSTFTNHTGVAATVWEGEYTYVRTNGAIYKETPGYYLDGPSAPISVLVQTGWLAVADIQNFERVRQLLMLGNFAGASTAHGVQLSFAYDFGSTFVPINPFYLTNSVNPPVYQFRGFLPQQKCDSVSILIQELTTGDSAENITFTDLALLVAMKKGFNKVAAAVSTG